MQISGLIISILLVLTLVASVTFISMQDEIIAFRNEKLQETVQSYEIQLAQMQANIDSLDKKHQLTQEWFKEITSTLELRHNELTKIFEKNANFQNFAFLRTHGYSRREKRPLQSMSDLKEREVSKKPCFLKTHQEMH